MQELKGRGPAGAATALRPDLQPLVQQLLEWGFRLPTLPTLQSRHARGSGSGSGEGAGSGLPTAAAGAAQRVQRTEDVIMSSLKLLREGSAAASAAVMQPQQLAGAHHLASCKVAGCRRCAWLRRPGVAPAALPPPRYSQR